MSDASPSAASPKSLPGLQSGADKAFRWGLVVFLLAGLVQIFLAGVGVFDLQGRDLQDASSFDPHRALGFAMSALSLVLLILALVARVSPQTILLALLLLVLSAVMQSVLAGLGEDTPFFGGLHAFDGLAILGLASYLHVAAIKRPRA